MTKSKVIIRTGIPITKDIYLTSDSRQFILSLYGFVETGKNKGQEKVLTNWYFPDLEMVFTFLFERQVRAEILELDSLEDLCRISSNYAGDLLDIRRTAEVQALKKED